MIPGVELEILSTKPDRITVSTGVVALDGLFPVSVIEDFVIGHAGLCQPDSCAPPWLGPVDKFEDPVMLVPSGVPVIGGSHQLDECSPIVVRLDRATFQAGVPMDVVAHLQFPSVSGVTPGGRVTRFQLSPATTFDECLGSLADGLRVELAGGGDLAEVEILPERHQDEVVLSRIPLAGDFKMVGHVMLIVAEVGRCGPENTHPIDDEREHGWCRFQELVEPCSGLPAFEWYIPLSRVKQVSSSLAGLLHPFDRSPHEKEIMLNLEAYCHVRRHRLWNLCQLETLVEKGRTDIPDFPVGAWVTKTIWRKNSEIPHVVDRN